MAVLVLNAAPVPWRTAPRPKPINEPPPSRRKPPPPMPKLLQQAWARGNKARLQHALEMPLLTSKRVSIHLLGVFHDDPVSGGQVCTALKLLNPDAVALEIPREVIHLSLGTATRLAPVIDTLSRAKFQDIRDIYTFLPDPLHAAWIRETDALPWKHLQTDLECAVGNLTLAEVLPALRWCKEHGVVADGIDLALDCDQRERLDRLDAQSSESDAICSSSFAAVLGPQLVQAAEDWAPSAFGVMDPEVATDLCHQALLATMTNEQLMRYVRLKRRYVGGRAGSAVHAGFYDAVLDERDAHMASRLVELCEDPGFLEARPPPSKVLAVVGHAHVAGITRELRARQKV